jgi:hypothetical protein
MRAPLTILIKVNARLSLSALAFAIIFPRSDRRRVRCAGGHRSAGIIMSRVLATLSAAAFVAFAAAPASAGCYNCYVPAPRPCVTCYQQQVVPPQYRTVHETVMVAPGRTVAHRTPARYETVMVPKTMMVEPERVHYEQLAPQYATVARTEMVAPARAYYVPVRPRCGNCGW